MRVQLMHSDDLMGNFCFAQCHHVAAPRGTQSAGNTDRTEKIQAYSAVLHAQQVDNGALGTIEVVNRHIAFNSCWIVAIMPETFITTVAQSPI